MAELFLHLAFARRLRFAQGLHPLAGEAIGRRPALVVLGASLAGLPARERQGMSWLRRLFSGGGEGVRWQKLLAPTPGQPHVELLLSVLRSDDASVGPLARFALAAGLLSHELLEAKVGALTSSMAGPQRAAVERAQARLWLQTQDLTLGLDNELRPALELADADAHKRTLQHIDRAIKRVHGSSPGEGSLGRWLKALAAEVTPLADANARVPGSGSLPPSLHIADADARAAHFDQAGFLDKTTAATTLFVTYANRLGEAFQKGSPELGALVEALGKLDDVHADVGASALRSKSWLDETREACLTRGRNPQPAFAEGEYQSPSTDHRLASVTKVMSLADLPPEATVAGHGGAPPLPEGSGPVSPPHSLAPNVTQEVSLAQIESEGFALGAAGEARPTVPAAPPADANEAMQGNVTQPISIADVAAANEEDLRTVPPPPPMTEPVVDGLLPSPPTTIPPEDVTELPPAKSAEDAAAATDTSTETNGANGLDHALTDTPAHSGAFDPNASPESEPPRE